jgi:hypothetical protein
MEYLLHIDPPTSCQIYFADSIWVIKEMQMFLLVELVGEAI